MQYTTVPAEKTTGIILAGGRSSRFGPNKSLALYRQEPLIFHVAKCLETIFSERLLVTNEPDTFAFLNWPMAGDLYRECGPLAGIHAALKKIKTEQGFVIACDMPLLKPEFISALCNLAGDWEAALPWLPSGPEPLHAVYRKKANDFLENQLNRGNYKTVEVIESLRLRTIDLDELTSMGGDLSVFYNINQKNDLEELETGNDELRMMNDSNRSPSPLIRR
ncbi:MAG: molybdenum cofactor guanylyltransferase [Desulfobia sp.]